MPGELALFRFEADLLDDVADLSYAGRADRMPFSLQPAARVDRFRAIARRVPGRRARTTLPPRHKAQIFESNDLGDSEAVMQLGELDVGRLDPSHLVSFRRSGSH